MKRCIPLLVAVALGMTAPSAHAVPKLGQAALMSCDKGVATFEGRIAQLRAAPRAQLRFTLQARTPEQPAWTAVPAPGFGVWITAPKGVARYLYDKTVERLLAPADYRAVVQFRWKDAGGRTVRVERAVTRPCRQPDPRPDLTITSLNVNGRLLALVSNAGRGPAGPFTVAFARDGRPIGTVDVAGLAAHATSPVALSGAPACAPGETITVQVDSTDAVDEADEAGNVATATC